MREIASIEIHIIVRELQGLVGKYLKKFHELGDDSFRFLFSSQSGSGMLYVRLVRSINATELAEDVGEATDFAIAVRKRILGRKLLGIRQHALDRIVVFEFSGDEGYKLVLEMFAKGNLILVDKDYRIALAYKLLKQKEREIRKNAVYRFPTSSGVGIESSSREQIEKILGGVEGSDDRIIRALSQKFDIGPLYLENILADSNIDPRSKITPAQTSELARGLERFFEELKEPGARIYLKDGKAVDYSAIPIRKYGDLETREFESLSRALEEFYAGERSKTEVEDSEMKEISASIGKQRKLIEEMNEEERLSTETANKIFGSMNEINRMIQHVGEKRRVTLEELQHAFPGLKLRRIDLKNKKAVIDL